MGNALAAAADELIRTEDVAVSIVSIVSLTNIASVSKFWVNCLIDESY